MILWEAVIEEIALEGLDGITLPTLWFRLQSRPDVEFAFDDAGKQWIWSYIRQRGNILAFYQVPEPRKIAAIGGDDEPPVDNYPVHVISCGPLWGSCTALDKRTDISGQISVGDAYSSLNVALDDFGSERLVVVASQSERKRVLLGSSIDFESVFRRESCACRQHYAMLERIGRSRYKGISAGSTDSLHTMFNLRAKDVFYIIKRLESFGIVTKQVSNVQSNGARVMNATIVMLTRFSTPLDKSRHLPQMRKLVSFLEGKEDKRALFSEVKEFFGIPTVLSLKKILQSFPGVVQSSSKRIEAPAPSTPSTPPVRKKRRRRRGLADDENPPSESTAPEETVSSPEARKITVRYFQLVGKLNVEEDNDKVVASKTANADECGLANGEDNDDGVDAVDWSKHNPFRTRAFEAMRIIRQAGADGVDLRQLRHGISITRKQCERLVTNLRGGTWFKAVVESNGKIRKTKYVWSTAEHQAEQHYRRFEALTGLRYEDLDEREKQLIGERAIRRMVFILERIEAHPVSYAPEFLKALRNEERSEGYNYALDKKCFDSLLKFLTTRGQLKTFITVLKESSAQRTVEFICHKRIVLKSPELQTKIAEVRAQMLRILLKLKDKEKDKEKEEEKGKEKKEKEKGIEKKIKDKGGRKVQDDAFSEPSHKRRKQMIESDPVFAKSAAAWRRSHPAVQLQQRMLKQKDAPEGNVVPILRRKRKRSYLDAVDKEAVERRTNVRAQFTTRERQMLLLMRAVSYVFYPGSRLWVSAALIRDLMHKYVPVSHLCRERDGIPLLHCAALRR